LRGFFTLKLRLAAGVNVRPSQTSGVSAVVVVGGGADDVDLSFCRDDSIIDIFPTVDRYDI
jgi:hypothetical protein